MTKLNEYLRRYSPPVVSVLALIALVIRSFNLTTIRVDWITIGLLAVIILAPYAQRLERISVANVEMDFRSEIDQAQKQVDESIEESSADSDIEPPPGFYSRINQIQALLDEDPILAVSDIRSEIYHHLWMFAQAEGISDQQLSTTVLIQRLEEDGVLRPSVSDSVQRVIDICNRAIHGGEIEQDEASDLAELGVDIIRHLHFLFHDQVVAPVETESISQKEVDYYRNAQYEVKSVTPLVNNPKLQKRIVPQGGLDTVLEGYHQYAEFLVEIEPLNSEG